MSSPDFDWNDEDQDCIVVQHQAAIAVYSNNFGSVVVRQQAPYGDADDFIIVTKNHALKVAKELLAAAGIDAEIVLTGTANPSHGGDEPSPSWRVADHCNGIRQEVR